MSADASLETVEAETVMEGFKNCPKCGYELPDNLVICWNCGAVLK